MDCSQIEFMAEDEYVTIIPRFNYPDLNHQKSSQLICRDIGPFKAGTPVDVPLWIAIYFKQIHKCTIQPPVWLNLDNLEDIKTAEKEEAVFTKLPNVYCMEIALLLLTNAPDDIQNGDELKTLLKDISDIRMSKIQTSVRVFIRQESTHAQMSRLTPLELCRFREVLTMATAQLRKLQAAVARAASYAPALSSSSALDDSNLNSQ